MHTSPLDQPGQGDAGGMNVYVSRLCRALVRDGHDVEVFVLDTGRTAREPETLTETDRGVRVHLVAVPGAAGARKERLPELVAPFARACAALVRAGEVPAPDVVHAHYWLSGAAAREILRDLGSTAPLVLTLHTSARSKDLHAGPGEAPEPAHRAEAEAALVAGAQALVVNTEAEAAEMVELYAADPRRVHVIPPGVDTAVFRPAPGEPEVLPPTPERPFRLLFAGRPQPLKGPDLLLRALALARRTVPTVLQIRGTGSPEYLASLHELADELGVAQAVDWVPAGPAEELAEAFRASDAVACPSSSETFGLVALEAQACGVPVLGSEATGLVLALDRGRSGVLVPERTPAAWAAAIAELAADPERRRALAAAGPKHARTLTWDRAADATAALYRALLDRRPHDRVPRGQEPTPGSALPDAATTPGGPSRDR